MNNKNIGATIFNLRKSKSLTQKQLSEIIFVSQKAISKWETGDGVPEFTNLMELAKVFNVSVDYILQGLGSDGVDSLNTTHKRYNTAFQNEDERQEENKIKDKNQNENQNTDEEKAKQNAEEKSKENNKENSSDNNDSNNKKQDNSNEPKRSVDEILSLVDNVAKKSAQATKTTLTLANEASQNRANALNQKRAGKKKKGPKLNLIAFFINILLWVIVAYNILENNNSYGIHYLTIFSLYFVLLIAVSVIILSVISLTGKDVKKRAKTFAILNIILVCLAVVLLFANNYSAGLFGFNINNFLHLIK